jgi:ribosomal protein S18 acetylase RimI-like enzyme
MLADYAARIASGSVYVIDCGEVRALIVLKVRDDHLFIENIAVRPEYQRQGLGRRLMQFAERQAREQGLNELRLYVSELMPENLGFYRRLGFEIVDRHLVDGYHRAYMRKLL